MGRGLSWDLKAGLCLVLLGQGAAGVFPRARLDGLLFRAAILAGLAGTRFRVSLALDVAPRLGRP